MTIANTLRLTGCLLVLAAGFAVTPASAETCRGGERFCSNALSFDIWRRGWHIRAGDNAPPRPRMRACDGNGYNCHYTRSYYINDDGNPRYDPSIGGDDVSEPQQP